MEKIIAQYKNGNYNVTVYEDGTKIKENDLDFFDADRPESIDLTVTYGCEIGCPFCYQNCTPDGENCNYNDPIINTFLEGMEVAIGASGGVFKDLENFEKFLEKLKNKKCIPSITVNQIHFIKHNDIIKKWIKEKLVWGIGVSYLSNMSQEKYDELNKCLVNLYEENLHNNIVLHLIAGVHTVEEFEKASNVFSNKCKPKVLVLGWKNIGRGVNYQQKVPNKIKTSIDDIKNKLLVKFGDMFKVTSFDNPAVEQLSLQKFYSKKIWDERFLGEDGTSTFYVDLVKRQFSITSLSTEFYPMDKFNTIQEMFLYAKQKATEKREKDNETSTK